MIKNLPKDKDIILFDGVCNLCNNTVVYVIKRDRADRFLFAPLQSNIGRAIIKRFNVNTSETDSILLFNAKDNSLKVKSTAALSISKHLGFPTSLWSVFLILPRFIRDFGYDIIAKNRYNWFGRKEFCMVPTPELKSKFIE